MVKIAVIMQQRRRHNIYHDLITKKYGRTAANDDLIASSVKDYSLINYLKFAFYCMMLIVPIYAIAISAINHDWIMMIIDALLVPVGFVHGLLLIFGYVS
jgi:hypothetical protein